MRNAKSLIYKIWSRRRNRYLVIIFFIASVLLLWLPTVYANLTTRSQRYDLTATDIHSIPYNHVGIVFGAGVTKDQKPTPYLQWRIDTAVQLYKAHKVDILLMSGDNSYTHYNEPEVMAREAKQQGVPANAIVLDYAGFNTYDTCYRSKAIFGLHSATLVSQGYHLPRAVMACDALGVRSIGVDARHDLGRDWQYTYIAREWISTDKIVLQQFYKPHPKVLDSPEVIK